MRIHPADAAQGLIDLYSEEAKQAEVTAAAFSFVRYFGALLFTLVIQCSAFCVDAVPAFRSVQQSLLTNRVANFLEV